MHTYFFQLGTTSKLSFAELSAVLADQTLESINEQLVCVSAEQPLDVQALQATLGGCVKIFESVATLVVADIASIAAEIAKIVTEGRVTFAFGEFNAPEEEKIDGIEIKKELVELGRSARFVEGNRLGVSAAVLLHQPKVQEFVVIHTPAQTFLAKTVGVQNIDDWTLRDRRKPYADRKRGMLPPKVARILLNLNASYDTTNNRVVLDPFCGSGNILLENATLGHEGIGVDLDKSAVAGSQANLEWLSKTYEKDHKHKVFVGDATHISPDSSQRVTAIVTEPFLGKPKPKPEQVADIFRGLGKLYLGAFKNWKTFLPNNAPVTIVFPQTFVGTLEYNMDTLIDKLLALGYTTVSGPLKYSRPDAIVSRSIYTFILKK